MRAVGVLAASILIIGSTGCAPLDSALEPKAGQELRPLAVGWEQFFTIDWQPTERKGQLVLEGTVVSRFGASATRVQLLVEGLDESGRVINQRVIWLGPSIGPFDRAEFWTPVTRSPKYRVRMFAFDWRDKGGGV
jgi:hypothetical protein